MDNGNWLGATILLGAYCYVVWRLLRWVARSLGLSARRVIDSVFSSST